VSDFGPDAQGMSIHRLTFGSPPRYGQLGFQLTLPFLSGRLWVVRLACAEGLLGWGSSLQTLQLAPQSNL